VIQEKAVQRLRYEGLAAVDEIEKPDGQFYKDPTGYAMHRFAYYMCHKCNVRPSVFGGRRSSMPAG